MKGGLIDLIYFSTALFIIVLTLAIIYFAFFQINNAFLNVSSNITQVLSITKRNLDYINNSLVIFYIIFLLAGLVSAYFSSFHPVLFIFALIFLAFSIIFGYIVKETITVLLLQNEFFSFINTFPIVNIILNNITIIIAVFGFLYVLVMFIRRENY